MWYKPLFKDLKYHKELLEYAGYKIAKFGMGYEKVLCYIRKGKPYKKARIHAIPNTDGLINIHFDRNYTKAKRHSSTQNNEFVKNAKEELELKEKELITHTIKN